MEIGNLGAGLGDEPVWSSETFRSEGVETSISDRYFERLRFVVFSELNLCL